MDPQPLYDVGRDRMLSASLRRYTSRSTLCRMPTVFCPNLRIRCSQDCGDAADSTPTVTWAQTKSAPNRSLTGVKVDGEVSQVILERPAPTAITGEVVSRRAIVT